MATASTARLDRDDQELYSRFAPFRALRAEPSSDLGDRCLDRVEAAITAQDLVEFGTAVLVTEFFGPVLDLLAFALGLDEQGETRG